VPEHKQEQQNLQSAQNLNKEKKYIAEQGECA
jgi:hypothetical protein